MIQRASFRRVSAIATMALFFSGSTSLQSAWYSWCKGEYQEPTEQFEMTATASNSSSADMEAQPPEGGTKQATLLQQVKNFTQRHQGKIIWFIGAAGVIGYAVSITWAYSSGKDTPQANPDLSNTTANPLSSTMGSSDESTPGPLTTHFFNIANGVLQDSTEAISSAVTQAFQNATEIVLRENPLKRGMMQSEAEEVMNFMQQNRNQRGDALREDSFLTTTGIPFTFKVGADENGNPVYELKVWNWSVCRATKDSVKSFIEICREFFEPLIFPSGT